MRYVHFSMFVLLPINLFLTFFILCYTNSSPPSPTNNINDAGSIASHLMSHPALRDAVIEYLISNNFVSLPNRLPAAAATPSQSSTTIVSTGNCAHSVPHDRPTSNTHHQEISVIPRTTFESKNKSQPEECHDSVVRGDQMCFDDPPSVDDIETDQGTKNRPPSSQQSSRVRIISVRPLRKPSSDQLPPDLDDYEQSDPLDDSDLDETIGIDRMQKNHELQELDDDDDNDEEEDFFCDSPTGFARVPTNRASSPSSDSDREAIRIPSKGSFKKFNTNSTNYSTKYSSDVPMFVIELESALHQACESEYYSPYVLMTNIRNVINSAVPSCNHRDLSPKSRGRK